MHQLCEMISFCNLTRWMTDRNLKECKLRFSYALVLSPATPASDAFFSHWHKEHPPPTARLTHTHTVTHSLTHANSFFLSLFWQFCVSVKTTGTVDISLWLRFHSLWSQPCCLASLKGHCCCLSKSQQKHTTRCSLCVRVCVWDKQINWERGKVCVFNLKDCKTRAVSQIISILSRPNHGAVCVCASSRCDFFLVWLVTG